MELITLHARPHECFAPALGVTYYSDISGIVHVAPEHVKAMLNSGCWQQGDSQQPRDTVPEGMVKLKGQPHAIYQPVTGVRLHADHEGLVIAPKQHIAALRSAGCKVVPYQYRRDLNDHDSNAKSDDAVALAIPKFLRRRKGVQQ